MGATVNRLCIALAVCLTSCGPRHASEAGGTEDERPRLAFTTWADGTELFVELPVLVRGVESPFAAHVTRLATFAALSEGTVTVVLRGGGGEERFSANRPTVPGIFRPIVRPRTSGTRRLVIEISAPEVSASHDLGEVTVFDSEAAAIRGTHEPPEPTGRITFLKEQQWPIPFGTEEAAERTLRPSLRVTGTLRGRPDGEILVTAPTAGRIAAAPTGFPAIGARITESQSLALLSPRLEASDQASLGLAVANARLDLQHAERERTRVETLRNEGAVPERRLVDAMHAEAEARAAVVAADQRMDQFRRVQRTGGGRSAGTVLVRSPLAGILVDIEVAPGAFVEMGAPLFHVADLTRLWLEAHVPEADAGRLDTLLGAWFEVDGGFGPVDVGPDALVGSSHRIDPATETMAVVYSVANPEGRMPLGSFARVYLVTGEPVRATAVPVTAVVDDNGQDVVFVQVEGESFERRVVRLGIRDRGFVEVVSGLRAGEHVVTRGAWSVKLAASSGSIPAHGHSH